MKPGKNIIKIPSNPHIARASGVALDSATVNPLNMSLIVNLCLEVNTSFRPSDKAVLALWPRKSNAFIRSDPMSKVDAPNVVEAVNKFEA